jgi:tRNA(fMet)-specific endonuclease VapC
MARLVDTSVFVDLERRERPLGDLDYFAQGEPIALASITASELLVGVHRTQSAAQRNRRANRVRTIFNELPVIDFDLAAAEVHALLSVHLASVGQSIGSHDLIIAATALSRGYELVTHNMRHFARVPGLVVVVPSS